jgi:hypothetical protein
MVDAPAQSIKTAAAIWRCPLVIRFDTFTVHALKFEYRLIPPFPFPGSAPLYVSLQKSCTQKSRRRVRSSSKIDWAFPYLPLVLTSASSPSALFKCIHPLARLAQTMNSKIAALMFAGLVSVYSLHSLAAEKVTEDATIPPSALPGLNQGDESNKEKADKKGEEAAGSNSGEE